jgi:hypothetical protein
MDSEGSQVPPVPARQPRVREGWPNVHSTSVLLKIIGWIVLIGSIAGGVYIASQVESSCTCNSVTFGCDCTDTGPLRAVWVVAGIIAGLSSALLFLGVAFALDMLEAIWLQTGGRRPRAGQ